MDFFESQDAARRKTSVLVFYYALAVIAIILAVYFAVAVVLVMHEIVSVEDSAGLPGSPAASVRSLWDPGLFVLVSLGTAAVILTGTLYMISRLSSGGSAVAQMLGGRLITPDTRNPDERRVLNVVEEMAIASGLPVPQVFMLENEDGINAFAAGFFAGDAVIGVTKGCAAHLSRDELQGVIGHEFSHILNGDMRLNIRLMGVLHGILLIAMIGRIMMEAVRGLRAGGRSRKGGGAILGIAALGLAIMIIGYIGVLFGKLIKSAVSRQREYLADAASVQFTRNPSGLAGALKKIGGLFRGSTLFSAHAESASHIFFSNALANSFLGLMASHPPLDERIKRIDPSFDGKFAVMKAQPGAVARKAAAEMPSSTGGRMRLDPSAVLSSVGRPMAEHLALATAMMGMIPTAASEAGRELLGAKALIFNLLLNRDEAVRKTQFESIRAADPAAYAETRRLMPALGTLGDQLKLPLAELLIPTLKRMSAAQYANFRSEVETLVKADSKISLFEYALQRMIVRHLDPAFGKARPAAAGNGSLPLRPLLPAAVDLLSCLAHLGTEDDAKAVAAFEKGMGKLAQSAFGNSIKGLNARVSLRLRAREQSALPLLDQALRILSTGASSSAKKLLLAACVDCVTCDGSVTVGEAEMLRAVADSLGCPMPPFLAKSVTPAA